MTVQRGDVVLVAFPFSSGTGSSPEGKQMGLLFDSAIACENIATVQQQLIKRKIGALPSTWYPELDLRLKVSLGIAT